ncbi:FtsH protease activity modulator HflK [Massilia sp. TS11]|uniref:FtsH protease activity modulator HflK n=1 Tax=Massilia sp. TS11 TaxID=2908003 RepID=UPI001EDA22A6|nr:FtsH protease activity modulator HflK [Massilia sp. TS11]MCG2583144.1 FtsH protease activity modulator HflK [Massilia sp. TS11]
MLANLLKRLRRPGHVAAQDNGPPDLEQLWRDFNARLNRLFGGRPQPPGQPTPGFQPGRGAGTAIVSVVGGAIVLIWLASGAFIVQEGQVGVITTFGKFSHTASPGFNWRWPYPFQHDETVNVSQVRTVEIGYRGPSKARMARESLMLTDDENIVDLQFAVQYKVKDAKDWLFNNRDVAEETMRQVAETAAREVVGRNKMDVILYENRERVSFDVQQLMQHILDRYKAGVLVTNVTMQNVQPPEQVQGAFDDAVKAYQDRERRKNEGQAYEQTVVPAAKGDAIRLIKEAEAYRATIVGNAAGDVARFNQVLAEYQKAPGVTRDRMYLETMQKIFSSTSKVLIDSKANSSMLYLPLDKIIAQSGEKASGAAAATPAPATAEPLPTIDSVRVREPGRSRDNLREREAR